MAISCVPLGVVLWWKHGYEIHCFKLKALHWLFICDNVPSGIQGSRSLVYVMTVGTAFTAGITSLCKQPSSDVRLTAPAAELQLAGEQHYWNVI